MLPLGLPGALDGQGAALEPLLQFSLSGTSGCGLQLVSSLRTLPCTFGLSILQFAELLCLLQEKSLGETELHSALCGLT